LAEYPGPLAQLHGTRAPFAPKWVASGSVNYDQPIGDALKAFAYVDAQYQSRANLSYSATTSADYFQAPYALVNGRVGIGDIDDHLTLELWARNLFNKRDVAVGVDRGLCERAALLRRHLADEVLRRRLFLADRPVYALPPKVQSALGE
jgi:outer membrane receptor protein involved in Fe transport